MSAAAASDAEQATKRQRTGDAADGDAEGAGRLPAEEQGSGDESASSSTEPRSACGEAAAPGRSVPASGIPFSLEALEKELAELRADPPPYVSNIGALQRPSVVCNDDGVIATPEGEGPFDLALCVAGEEGDAAYGYPVRVVLRFDSDLWPSKLAIVRVRGVFHHALTDEGGGMLMPFYRALVRDERGACTLRLMLGAVRRFLVEPMGAWNIPPEKAPQQIEEAIELQREVNIERLSVIRKYASRVRHPELFKSPAEWRQEWLDPAFAAARRAGSPDGWRAILREHAPGEVFSFKILSDEFCKTLVEEIFNFYATDLPARRPNSMNNYGIILNDIGLEPLVEELQRMLQPLGELLFPGAGNAWDGQHCFIVRYRAGEDLGLDMHTDDSDVTFNICLGLDFKGAGLQFCGLMGAPDHRKHSLTYEHSKGACVCHLGRKRHGADDIESGERMNLILWNHSSTYRQTDEYIKPDYVREEGPPDARCTSYSHDRDYGNFKQYPAGKEKFKGRGWCPRPLFEYAGFKPDCEDEQLTCCHV